MLEYKKYPSVDDGVQIIKEHGIDYYLEMMDDIKCHNISVVERRGNIFTFIIIFIFFLCFVPDLIQLYKLYL